MLDFLLPPHLNWVNVWSCAQSMVLLEFFRQSGYCKIAINFAAGKLPKKRFYKNSKIVV